MATSPSALGVGLRAGGGELGVVPEVHSRRRRNARARRLIRHGRRRARGVRHNMRRSRGVTDVRVLVLGVFAVVREPQAVLSDAALSSTRSEIMFPTVYE